ncbi:MAG: hypothetical protein ACYCSN_20050 [Acidobacteriaceae bacterium]
MCRNITPPDERVECSRCGGCANPNDGWEHVWPLYGHLEIGFPGQAFGHLGGCDHTADGVHFDWWAEGHPAMTKNEAQEVIFEWGNGFKFDSTGRYRLCYDCQKKLLHVVGEFFGIRRRVEELKRAGVRESDV